MPYVQSSQAVAPAANPSSVSMPDWMQRALLSLAVGVSLMLGNGGVLESASSADPPAPPLADGTYAFGEHPTPGILGMTYLVLQVTGHQVVGGFYQPSSSFDCFQGETVGNTLALTVVDSYDQTAYRYQLALDTQTQTASQAGAGAIALVPSGFYPITPLTEVDQAVLTACQNRF